MSNVVSLFSGEVYKGEDGEAQDEIYIDEGAVALLEKALERAKKGELCGVVIVASIWEGKKQSVISDFSLPAVANQVLFIGALDMAKSDIMCFEDEYHDGDHRA